VTIGLRQTASMADFFVRVNGAHQDKHEKGQKHLRNHPAILYTFFSGRFKKWKVKKCTFWLFDFSSSLDSILWGSHVQLKRHPAKKSQSQKVKSQKVSTSILFDLLFDCSAFWLFDFFFPLNGLTFALLAAHVRPKRHPSKNQKVKK
jgi:hypothetical protein